MATRLLFSFDLNGAPPGEELPSLVLEAVGNRRRQRVLSRVWLLECRDEDDAKDFSGALNAIKARRPDFFFVVLAWVHGSPDVYVAAREAA